MAFAAVIVLQTRCWAQNNPPPAGAILDLNGTPIPGGGNGTTYQQYTVDFAAKFTSTAVTLLFVTTRPTFRSTRLRSRISRLPVATC